MVMNNKGDFTFSGHMHNSGFNNIGYVATAVVITPSAIAYSMQHSGHTEGTSAGLPFGTPKRNDDWVVSGNNPQIRDNWEQVSQEGSSRVSMLRISSLADSGAVEHNKGRASGIRQSWCCCIDILDRIRILLWCSVLEIAPPVLDTQAFSIFTEIETIFQLPSCV